MVKLNVRKLDVNVVISTTFQYMVPKIFDVLVNILIKHMILIKEIVNLVHVRVLLQLGLVPVVKNFQSIKLCLKPNHKNKQKEKLSIQLKEESSHIAACLMELIDIRQESNKK